LLAFFLESTFLGLWIFGWDRLPKKLHLASIWLAATGTVLSAYFILAANAWMQHPVGYVLNAEKGRAELVDIKAVLTQKNCGNRVSAHDSHPQHLQVVHSWQNFGLPNSKKEG
jgi:cytochrome bd-type quinol oxidase subunit 1